MMVKSRNTSFELLQLTNYFPLPRIEVLLIHREPKTSVSTSRMGRRGGP